MPPQSRQGKRRISTRRDNEMHLRWQVFHKKGKGVLNSRILNHMVVIEHQGKVRQLHAHEIVDEQSKREFYRCWRRGLQQRQARAPDLARMGSCYTADAYAAASQRTSHLKWKNETRSAQPQYTTSRLHLPVRSEPGSRACAFHSLAWIRALSRRVLLASSCNVCVESRVPLCAAPPVLR